MLNAIEVSLLWLVLQAAATDLAVRKIPNVLVLTGLLLALALHWRLGPDGAWLATGLAGALAGFFLFLPLYAGGGMAAGDVKLMAMVGAFAGPMQVLLIAALSVLAGGVLSMLILMAGGGWRQGWRNAWRIVHPWLLRLAGYPLQPVPLPHAASVGSLPYGVAVAAGTVLALLAAHQ